MRGAQIREREVFFYRHVRRGAAERVLKQPPDNAAALMLRCEGDVTSRKRYAAGVGIEAARYRVEERGFPRAVRADNGRKVARLKMQREVGKCAFFIHGAGVEGFGDVLYIKHVSSLPFSAPRACGAGTPPIF